MDLAAEEYRRLDRLLRSLDAADWSLPTDCSEWDVQAMVAHLVGAAHGNARMRESVHQLRVGRRLRPGEAPVHGINAAQVSEREERSPSQLMDDLAFWGERGVRARRRLPAPIRAIPMPMGDPIGVAKLGYLMDCIYTRDAWMHRVDISRATGRGLELTDDHDGRIIRDVADEWARIHGRPVRLVLSGPVSVELTYGDDVEELTVDAVEFCRVVSGRATGTGLMATPVPF
jgi:uncharacterized protein (TIGR03083 family)